MDDPSYNIDTGPGYGLSPKRFLMALAILVSSNALVMHRDSGDKDGEVTRNYGNSLQSSSALGWFRDFPTDRFTR